MRQLLIVMIVIVFGGCTHATTPSCADKSVIGKIVQLARQSIESDLLEDDPAARIDQVMERLAIGLADIESSDHDETIDKHSCTANLRIALPPEIAALKDHRAFRLLALGQTSVEIQGNDIVAPVTYTTYLSQDDQELIVRAQGEQAPARYIQAAYKVGAFDADLRTLPDLRGGLTLYSGPGKTLLIEPVENGSLQFHVNYERNHCRPWAQLITEERGDTLVYDNPEVGCTVLFSRLGEILLVEHKGCEMMARSCSPDGVYQKQ
ncbi:MAG TPA: hypothetical protein VMW70_15415 [Burkholderiales bacterium]|nr:hypothetical protein [Burkholderiales bacterium]